MPGDGGQAEQRIGSIAYGIDRVAKTGAFRFSKRGYNFILRLHQTENRTLTLYYAHGYQTRQKRVCVANRFRYDSSGNVPLPFVGAIIRTRPSAKETAFLPPWCPRMGRLVTKSEAFRRRFVES